MLRPLAGRTGFNGAVADSQYPYPPDRFDDEADAVSFHGAHRAELPFWRENLLYIIVIGAAVVMLIVLLFLIGGMGGDGDERADDPTTTTSAAESSEAPAEEAPEDAPPAPEPDLATPVLVVNAGGINGLAGSWQETLQGDGWEAVDVATADNVQQEPVVFYRDAEDADTAQALAEQVGAGEARQSDEYDARVTFVAVAEPGASAEGEGDEDG